jgi:enoyl-CoA hydratase/carnithine racemase
MTITYNTLSFQLEDGVGHIEFNQPPSNEMSLGFFSELGLLTDRLRSMDGIKALIISGKGRHFSSGARLDELLALAGQVEKNRTKESTAMLQFLNTNNRSFLFLQELEIPVISAIRGVCLGSAFEITLFTHFRFCGEDAIFGLPETTYNLIPGIGGISRIFSLAGSAASLEIALRGNTFSAEEALKLNLVDSILPKKEVLKKAREFALSLPSDYKKEKAPLYLKRFFSGARMMNEVGDIQKSYE